ncbi:hypothetical protein K435DRAFT_801430 [Dendrothele bispora CBS 962.96]|uniref:Uncharacterized protein n=1 Tax=Dendrothele bispora (strain CBS 962.96) TaxID=1314807 RepID=A0A4S8LPB4_DENBC|nr:hypothetical protein K435DRAFT_801430 [Dendrothele bispora CBS 962.96]
MYSLNRLLSVTRLLVVTNHSLDSFLVPLDRNGSVVRLEPFFSFVLALLSGIGMWPNVMLHQGILLIFIPFNRGEKLITNLYPPKVVSHYSPLTLNSQNWKFTFDPEIEKGNHSTDLTSLEQKQLILLTHSQKLSDLKVLLTCTSTVTRFMTYSCIFPKIQPILTHPCLSQQGEKRVVIALTSISLFNRLGTYYLATCKNFIFNLKPV